eukprot:CAMPEP_0185268838 /NCGR_PEP_ID=MMETSP1359-20130426/38152_1 /TAXON_ID=552665 /ORGANISM="Bigelowiella longifila, Strain CCMP242" /LENGTH=102 /DNA_ID=CAMNT_0027859755 /DNA_START=19 /DNA_END=324 /DNA_ORIENTATION=-
MVLIYAMDHGDLNLMENYVDWKAVRKYIPNSFLLEVRSNMIMKYWKNGETRKVNSMFRKIIEAGARNPSVENEILEIMNSTVQKGCTNLPQHYQNWVRDNMS